MKKTISIILCAILVACMATTARAADDDFEIGQTWDDSILAGGIFDMYAWVGGEIDDYTYQWRVDVSMGDGRWVDLEDNADPYGYVGTDTYHLQMITPRTNGYIIGTGWEDIPFCCAVTSKKTGVTKYTASIFMNVFTSDDLEEYMAEKGIELYTPSRVSGAQVTTTDDETYYTTAEAGTALKFTCGYAPPQNVHLMGRSDMQGDVEVWITEGGKTVKKENGATYIPYTIGKDAVTVQYKLHYTLGIHDMGYYQTKTLKLSTNAPQIVGRGTAKQAMSLLKEPYSQSQKLDSIPKGGIVYIHKNSGSWYQVSYGDHIGYVAGSALNCEDYTPIIEHVDVTIAEPAAGNIPATSNTVTPDSCFVTSVDWRDLTEDRFMEKGDRFQKGHDYQLIIWISAKEDHWFKLDSNDKVLTKVLINENLPAYVSRAYEQIIGKVIDVRYDFTNVQEAVVSHSCKPAPVARVNPTCTEAGQEAHYKCSCGKTYADQGATQEVKLSTWGKIAATGHKEGTWTGNGTHHYKKCTVCYAVISGTNAPHSGGVVVCEQKPVCATCGISYGSYGAHEYSTQWTPILDEGHAHMCQRENCTAHDTVKPHTPGPGATEAAAQSCTACGYIIAPALSHSHSLKKVEEVAPTCTKGGNKSYYVCSGCSDWFADAEGKQTVSDKNALTVPPVGHTAQGWQQDDISHWQPCLICHTEMQDTRTEHTDANADAVCDICSWRSTDKPEEKPTDPSTVLPTEPEAQESAETSLGRLLYLIPVVCFAVAMVVTALLLTKKKKN